jgi:hypothetical protein
MRPRRDIPSADAPAAIGGTCDGTRLRKSHYTIFLSPVERAQLEHWQRSTNEIPQKVKPLLAGQEIS